MSVLDKVLLPAGNNPDDVRMTLGEHLEELRTRLIRALIGLFIGAVVCYMFVDYVEGFLIWPVDAIYQSRGLDADIRTLGPAERFMTDLKVAIIVGLIVSAPYSITQIWGFIAAGLYPNERKWVRGFAPVSIALFFTGAIFLIVVVNPLLLKFLLTYGTELPDVAQYMPEFLLRSEMPPRIGAESAATQPTSRPAPEAIPAFPNDPPEGFAHGVPWVNLMRGEIRIRYQEKTYVLSHLREVGQTRVVPDIRLAEIIPFTLQLAAAFGIGFQVPVVVAFLAALGIFSAADMAKFRRHVIFIMSIAAAVFTPSPDPFSMMMLLVPMVGLFEAGLLVARRIERKRAAAAA